MIDREAALPIVRQCELLELSRSSVYYEPRPVSAAGSDADAPPG